MSTIDEPMQGDADETVSSAGTLVRDFIVFQVKLVLDGLKDVILGPLSFCAFLVSLLSGQHGPEAPFYRVLEKGHDIERAINLFGAVSPDSDWSDDLVASVEESMAGQQRS